jgi:hypothetical protein
MMTMKKIRYSVILLFALLFASCANNPVLPDQTQVVLHGYLYANEPVSDIQLTSSRLIGSADTTDPPISNATVALLKNGTRYQLSPNNTQPGYYYYTGNDLSVTPGDDFTIEARCDGGLVTSETIVPQKPEQIAFSTSIMRFQTDTVQTRFGTRTAVNGLDTAIVTWSNPNGDYFYVVIESIDSTRQLLGGDSLFTRRFTSQPTNETFYRVNNNSIRYTGKHLLKVYRVNREYADLYRSREQDSRALNEPLTNVKNGLGIFSAFASDSLSFTVTLDQ